MTNQILAPLELMELPVELTEAELDAVSGGQFSVTIGHIGPIGINIGGGFVTATANSVTSTGGQIAAAAGGIDNIQIIYS